MKFDVDFCTSTKVINTAAFNQVKTVSPPLDRPVDICTHNHLCK